MRWVTAVGAWGDSFVAFGTARAMLAAEGVREFGVVHYGFDPSISAFLALQEGVAAIKHVRPENQAAYRYALSLLGNPTIALADYADILLAGTGLEPSQVLRTHVYHLNHRQTVHRWHSPILPQRALVWAKNFVERTCEGLPFVLLHPYSTQSSAIAGHWPYWQEALLWLCSVAEERGVKLLWTGMESPFDLRAPSLVNALRLTPSMLEVFALQRLARLTISTTNGLAHWAVMDACPTIACCNNHMLPTDRHVFKRWIDHRAVTQVEYTDRLSRFQALVCNALTERPE